MFTDLPKVSFVGLVPQHNRDWGRIGCMIERKGRGEARSFHWGRMEIRSLFLGLELWGHSLQEESRQEAVHRTKVNTKVNTRVLKLSCDSGLQFCSVGVWLVGNWKLMCWATSSCPSSLSWVPTKSLGTKGGVSGLWHLWDGR